MRATIYALVDPREPCLFRYIGKTRQPERRLARHRRAINRPRKNYREKWLSKLRSESVQPDMVTLARVPVKHEDAAERELIKRHRAGGHPLTNGTNGGEGGLLTPELQARATAKLKRLYAEGKLIPPKRTPEQTEMLRKKLRKLRTGDGNPMKRLEVRAKNSASQKARCEKLGLVKYVSKTKRGTPEWRAMQAEWARRNSQDPEVLKKISKALKGRKKSAKHRAAMAAAQAARSGLFLNGDPITFLGASKRLGVDARRMYEHAKRHGISRQETIDYFAANAVYAVD